MRTTRPIEGHSIDRAVNRRGGSPELNYPLPAASITRFKYPDPSHSFRDTAVLVAITIFISLIAAIIGISAAVLYALLA